jgi:hypothetical protein
VVAQNIISNSESLAAYLPESVSSFQTGIGNLRNIFAKECETSGDSISGQGIVT